MNNSSDSKGNNTQKIQPQQLIDPINYRELIGVLWTKKWILLASFIVGAFLAYMGTKLTITPQYQSSSMIYVYSKTTSVSSIISDIQLGSQLTVDFQIIATTREVIESAIEDLGINASYGEMVGKISISNPANSHILKVTATDPDPEFAAEISNAVANELRKRIADVMNTDEPSFVEKAVPSGVPVGFSIKNNVLKGGLLFLAATAGIYILIFIMDDSIKSEDDVEKYLHQSVLAVFPMDPTLTSQNNGGRKHSRRNHY